MLNLVLMLLCLAALLGLLALAALREASRDRNPQTLPVRVAERSPRGSGRR